MSITAILTFKETASMTAHAIRDSACAEVEKLSLPSGFEMYPVLIDNETIGAELKMYKIFSDITFHI